VAPSLQSVHLKLNRAEEHLKAVIEILSGFAEGQCNIIPEEDKKSHMGILRVQLPKPPLRLSIIIGDFLFNARSALDHLVMQLVLLQPHTAPGVRNMFPICSTPDSFAAALKGRRLHGIPDKARTLIESLQPYSSGNESLGTLADLHDIDKHRMLNLTTAVAQDTFIDWSSGGDNPFVSMFIGGEELRDGAIFGPMMPLDNPKLLSYIGRGETLASFRKRFLNMKVQGKTSIFVAFYNPTADELEPLRIDIVLPQILKFVREAVIPRFEPFFD
jgi:hypothetical protein